MNTTKLSAALLGSVMALALAQPSFAQARRAAAAPAAAPVAAAADASASPVVTGLAVADLEGIVAASDAARAAAQQRQTTYKAQIDAFEARRKALDAQLQPLAAKYQADAKAAKPDQNSLVQQATAIRQLQESGQQELNGLAQPIALSEAYVQEQITGKLGQAVSTAMARKRISILLNPTAVITAANPVYDLSRDVLTDLNRLIPTAQVVPPAGWQPRQARDAQAQAQGAASAAAGAPARPAGAQPDGR
jgi:Skp family chaperone for outer membrane proteins